MNKKKTVYLSTNLQNENEHRSKNSMNKSLEILKYN